MQRDFVCMNFFNFCFKKTEILNNFYKFSNLSLPKVLKIMALFSYSNKHTSSTNASNQSFESRLSLFIIFDNLKFYFLEHFGQKS